MVVGHNDEIRVITPLDDHLLAMPSQRLNEGGSAVRFGCFVAKSLQSTVQYVRVGSEPEVIGFPMPSPLSGV